MTSGLSAKETLELFNEKVDVLESSRYLQELRKEPRSAIVQWEREKGWDSVFVGPKEESVRAFILTLRFFMQNNESISIHNMAQLYGNDQTLRKFNNKFSTIRNNLNSFLDSSTNLAIEENQSLTYREILEIFVYGNYAHANERKRKIFKDISSTPFFPIFQVDLNLSIINFLGPLQDIKDLNESVLSKLP